MRQRRLLHLDGAIFSGPSRWAIKPSRRHKEQKREIDNDVHMALISSMHQKPGKNLNAGRSRYAFK